MTKIIQYIYKKRKKHNPTWQDMNYILDLAGRPNNDSSISTLTFEVDRMKIKKEKIGVMVAFPSIAYPGRIEIGWSLCNTSKADIFDCVQKEKENDITFYTSVPNLGLKLARKRAGKWADLSTLHDIPHSIQEDVGMFAVRCQKFYKGMKLPLWTLRYQGVLGNIQKRPQKDVTYNSLSRKEKDDIIDNVLQV